MSQLALDLIAKEKAERTGHLDLGNCGLTILPNELFELTWLTTLILANWYWIPAEGEATESSNHEEPNNIKSLPSKLKDFLRLKKIVIGGELWNYWECSNIEILGELKTLEVVVVQYSKVLNFDFLNKLPMLYKIDLHGSEAKDFTGISMLNDLKSLEMSFCKIDNFDFLSNLTNLENLYLNSNKISNTDFLTNLVKLNHLSLNNNLIENTNFVRKLTSLKVLKLHSNKISIIKYSKNLYNLQGLLIGFNPIKDFSFLEPLANLKELNLSSCDLYETKYLFGLINLEILKISYTRFDSYDFLGNLSKLRVLSVNSSGFVDTSILKYLTLLEDLSIGFNTLSDFAFLEKLLNLKKLNINSCLFSDGHYLRNLNKLKSLEIAFNPIYDLGFISQLENLENLNLSSIKSKRWTFLRNLTNLKSLFIDNNEISDLSFLINLINLKTLHISQNKIQNANILGRLINLEVLNIGDNQIFQIKFLWKLSQLKTINLSNNPFSDISSLKKLKRLSSLYLNNVTIKNYEYLNNLSNLQVLHINNNKIENADFLNKITSLKELSINYNKLSYIDFIKNLSKIITLDISNNNIKDLSFLLDLPDLNSLQIQNNEVKVPVDIQMAGVKAIIEWLRNNNNKSHAIHLLNQAKILLLGNTNVGKSFLLHFIQTGTLPNKVDSTHGLIYKSFNKFGKQINVFDFGGQEYFHATHKLFFSKEALHLLLWTKESEQREGKSDNFFELDYWLRCIQQLSIGEKNKKSIETILIENKIDKQEYLPSLLNFDSLQSKFKEIKINHTAISLQENKRLEGLIELISERLLALPTFQNYYTTPYLRVIDRIEELRKKDILVANPKQLLDEDTKESMEVFHNIGIVLYYPEILPNIVFISPQSFLDLLYKKILDDEAKRKNGKLSIKTITKEIYGNKLNITCNEVISLLEYFDVIFQIENGSDIYYAPQYLPDKANNILSFFANYYFQKPSLRIESDSYLLNLVMLKIFTEFGKNVKDGDESLFWKDGIVIEKNGKLLYIQYNRSKNHIDLYSNIQGENWSLQEDVVKYILEVPENEKTKSYLGILANYQINTNVSYSDSESKSYDEAQKRLWSESPYFKISVSIDGENFALWKDIQEAKSSHFVSQNKWFYLKDFKLYLTNKNQMKKIFISYSKEDFALVTEFLKHLASLKINNIISTWYCTELIAGEKWDEKIQDELNSSDIVCFMVSSNFMSTAYIQNYEVKKAIDKYRKKNSNFKIVPIIMRPCMWVTDNEYNLGNFTALPYIGKPVTDFDDRHTAWYIVVECLNLMIRENIIESELPKAVIKIYERIMAGELDKNRGKTKE